MRRKDLAKKGLLYEGVEPKAEFIREDLQKYPHKEDERVKHDDRYEKRNYVSIQTRVNNDKNFESKYFNKLGMDGWVSLQNPEDIIKIPKGKMFKYRLNGNSMSGAEDGTFRSGGVFIGKNYDDESESQDDYILYKGYNGCIFSLQLKDIQQVYIKSEKRKVPVFKIPYKTTNFPVYLPDPDTDEPTIVYYAKDEDKRRRFMLSEKFKIARGYGIWSWEATFNEEL